MTEFDHELIAALAEGQLPAAEAAELEARIAADPEASAELEAQRTALAALAAAAPPSLDDLERRRLHRSVAADLDIVLPAPASRPRRRFDVNWAALATAAAVLLGVALLAPVLSLLNTSGGDSAADTTVEVAAAESADEQELATSQDRIGQDFAAAEAPAETSAPAAAAEGAPPTTSALADSATTVLEDLTTAAAGDFAPYGTDGVADLGILDDGLAPALQRSAGDAAAWPVVNVDDDAEPFPCLTQLLIEVRSGRLAAEPVAVVGTGTLAGVSAYVLAAGDPTTQLLALAVADCSTLAAETVE